MMARMSAFPSHAVSRSHEHELQMLVEEYGSWVRKAAARLGGSGLGVFERADLEHEGLIGLFEAWRSFNRSCGVPFYGYARFRIRGAMIDNIRRQARLPRRLSSRMREIDTKRVEQENLLGRSASVTELAGYIGVPPTELLACHREHYYRQLLHLDAVQEPEDGEADLVAFVEGSQFKAALASALQVLSEAQRKVLRLYYGMELTQLQISRAMHLSEGRVSQIRVAALIHLRAELCKRGHHETDAGVLRHAGIDILDAL